MYTEEELLPISALQHLAFCERQWGLIHLEGSWVENRLTAEGRGLHERVHEAETRERDGVRVARSLRLHSLRLGVVGVADVVEFTRLPDSTDSAGTVGAVGAVGADQAGARLQGVPGLWRAVPVEYKRGRPKAGRCDEVQLCAQGLCLEEMLEVTVPQGALFYGKQRRRHEVRLDPGLRAYTQELAARLHRLTAEAKTPAARYDKRCKNCSLLPLCLPRVTGARRSALRYLSRAVAQMQEEIE